MIEEQDLLLATIRAYHEKRYEFVQQNFTRLQEVEVGLPLVLHSLGTDVRLRRRFDVTTGGVPTTAMMLTPIIAERS